MPECKIDGKDENTIRREMRDELGCERNVSKLGLAEIGKNLSFVVYE